MSTSTNAQLKKDNAELIEYGQVIDPRKKIYPDDVAELVLDPGHPGENFPDYIKRRHELFDLCRGHRLNNLGPPRINYTEEETTIWREVAPKLHALHDKHACAIYLEGRAILNISETEIPQLCDLSKVLEEGPTKMHLIPAEGALDYTFFYEYIENRGLPVTQFLRHGSHPEFTPEPDMIHDCLGHVPPLANRDYADYLVTIAKGAMAAKRTEHSEAVLLLKRFSWFSTEFGLIDEGGETKVFGAGILSSCAEIPNALFSKDVMRRPFVTEEVIETDYDPSQMQNQLFIIPSFAFLLAEAKRLVARLNLG